ALARRSCVGDDDDEVRAAFSEHGRNAVDDWRRIVEAKPDDIAGARSRGCGDGRDPDNSDFGTAALHDRIVWNPAHVSAVGVADIGAEYSELRLSHSSTQCIDSPIEFVVAECRRGVANFVVVVNDWTAK